mmetsp:Transcript_14773/g.17308  ORF Transcript_14773/g.17308 Transcript_14773/m.17308 type:complete len:359 (+) Transcript_14773:268-1344(+)
MVLESLPKQLITIWRNNGYADPFIRDEIIELINILIDGHSLQMEEHMVSCLQEELDNHWHESGSLLTLYASVIDKFASTSQAVNRTGLQFAPFFCERILLGFIDFSNDLYSDAVVTCFRAHWIFLLDDPIVITRVVAKLYDEMEIDRHILTLVSVCIDMLLFLPAQQNLHALKLAATLGCKIELCSRTDCVRDGKLVRALARTIVLQRSIGFLPIIYVQPLIKRMVEVGGNYCMFALGVLSPALLCEEAIDQEIRFSILVEFIRFSQPRLTNNLVPVQAGDSSDHANALLADEDLDGMFLWDAIDENVEDSDSFTEEENCSVVLNETKVEIERVLQQFALQHENQLQKAYHYVVSNDK